MDSQVTVPMPDIGEGVAEGEVIEWLKAVGDAVAKDEPVVVVMTDKATVELPSPQAGIMGRQYYRPGEMVAVGSALYDIDSQAAVKRPLALPKTRQEARAKGVDIGTLSPTGKHGEVTEADFQSTQGDNAMPLIGIQRLMAERMAQSNREIPHFSYFEELDATRLVQLRQNIRSAAFNEGINVTYMPFIVRALSLTLRQFPKFNATIDAEGKQLILHAHHNIGIAVTTERGLIVPVLKDAQEMKLQDIIRAFDALKERARSNGLLPDEMKGSTITLSNYGVLGGGGLFATPVISPGESAILAVARIQRGPFVKNDELVVRDKLNLSWSFDHRIIDGALAAEGSHFFAKLLENPAALL